MASVGLSKVTVVLQRYPGTDGSDADRALPDVPYVLKVNGKEVAKGKSGADGTIVVFFKAGADARLEVLDTVYKLKSIAKLEGAHTLKGQQRRLQGLGYELGEVDGIMGKKSGNAVLTFQADNNPLDTDGTFGAAVQTQLKTRFGE